MKKTLWYISVALLAVSLVLCFIPTISFSISQSAIDNVRKDVEKLQGKLDDAQVKLDELKAEGAETKALNKQEDKVIKAQEKLDEGQANLTAVEQSGASQKSISLFNAGLVEGVEINNIVVNESGVYNPNLAEFAMMRWVLLALLAFALLMTFLGAGKLASPVWSMAALAELAAAFVACYIVMRQSALPIKAPFGSPEINPLIWLIALLPIFALALNVVSYRKSVKTMVYTLCIFLSLLSLFPFWIMIVNATRSTNQIQQGLSIIPSTYLQNNWRILMGKNFDVMLGVKNSSIISFSATFLAVYFSSLCAYGIVVYPFKGRNLLFSFILAIIMIPSQVSGIGFYMYMYQIGWTDSFLPLILPAIAAPGTVFFMKQYLEANFQISLVEAARIDGASEVRTYNQIVMPIMMPALATMGIMAVIGSWNNYLTPLMLLKDPMKATLPMMVRTLRGDIYRTEFGSIYLGLALTALPLMIVYFALSKYIIQGIALGGVKE